MSYVIELIGGDTGDRTWNLGVMNPGACLLNQYLKTQLIEFQKKVFSWSFMVVHELMQSMLQNCTSRPVQLNPSIGDKL